MENLERNALKVYFETITIMQNNVVKVWLHHPYRMLMCDYQDLIRDSRETAQPNIFPINHFTEYKSLPPFQDSKMPILWEVNPIESLTNMEENLATPRSWVQQFIIDREEFNRIVTTTEHLLRLHH